MSVVKGVMEQIHQPLYDSISVEPGKQLRTVENSSTLKFFVNVQGKTKLETNLQSASLLPHYNTFEARALRLVISDLPPVFPDDVPVQVFGEIVDSSPLETQEVRTNLRRLMELLEEARADDDEVAIVFVLDRVEVEPGTPGAEEVALSLDDLESALEDLDRLAPPKEQIIPNNGAGTLIGKLIYNTVITFYIGEKVALEGPAWLFPSGAGPYSDVGRFTTHGEPSPTATFRFATPASIDQGQNFRVEMNIPDTDVLREIQKIYGPFRMWLLVDGYMTRDVQ
jgi:hypothetical protein